MTIEEIRKNAPAGATGYYKSEEYGARYIRKTPKNYYMQERNGSRWWKVPVTALRYVLENYKPLY